MVVGDIYSIEDRLRELDPDISLDFDYSSEQYRVYHKKHFVMYWPMPLDDRLIKHMRSIDVRRKDYDPLREVIDHNEKLELSLDKTRRERLEDVVKDYHPYLRDDIDEIKMKHVF